MNWVRLRPVCFLAFFLAIFFFSSCDLPADLSLLVHPKNRNSNPGGSSTGWAQAAISANNEGGYASVTSDGSGRIYCCGYLNAGNFDFGTGVFTPSVNGEGLITVYDHSGVIQRSICPVASTAPCTFQSVKVDGVGNIYVGGYIYDSLNIVDLGNGKTAQDPFSAGPSILLAQYDSSGTAQWITTFSSVLGSSAIEGICLDGGGGIYVSGRLYQNGIFTFPDGTNVQGTAGVGKNNILLARFDNAGNAIWARSISAGSLDSSLSGVAANSGGVWAIGNITANGLITPQGGVSVISSFSGANAFICRYDTNGNYLWGRSTVAGTLADSGFSGIAFDAADNCYAVGYIKATGPVIIGGITVTAVNGTPANPGCVIYKFDSAGNAVWGKTVSVAGSGVSAFTSVAVDNSGNIWAAGYVVGNSLLYDFGNGFIVTGGSPGTIGNLLVVEYDPGGNVLNAFSTPGGTTESLPGSITVTPQSKVVIAGKLIGSSTIQLPGNLILTPAFIIGNMYNPFVLQLP